jgi:hypothetical protein
MGLTPAFSPPPDEPWYADRAMDRETLTAALDAANIPWKRRGAYIDADVTGTGHYDHKCTPGKGVYIHSDGRGGLLVDLLKSIGQYPKDRHGPEKRPAPVRGAASVARILQSALPHPKTSMFTPVWARGTGATNPVPGANPWAVVARYLECRGLPFSLLPRTAKARCVRDGVDLLVPLANGRLNAPAMHVTMLTADGGKRGEAWLDGDCRYTKGPMRSPKGGAAHALVRPPRPAPLQGANEGAPRRYCVGEGLESTASGVLLSGHTGIFAVTRGGMAAFLNDPVIVDRLRAESAGLLILVDLDRSGDGQRSALELFDAARRHDIQASYCAPPDAVRGGAKGADWNDALMELGEDAARTALSACIRPPLGDEVIYAGMPDTADAAPDQETASRLSVM